MKLYILRYNNYYNRILKKFDTIAEYLVNKTQGTDFDIQEHVSFNPNDGVTTSQVVNFDASKYDYLLACSEPDTLGQSDIMSRWFIIEAQRTRSGQYQLQLQRDLLVDYYDSIKDAPAFIERGMLGADDPFIFNDEGLRYNQIKKNEYKLYDASRCSWIVGYVPRKMTNPNNPEEEPSSWNIQANVTESVSSADYTYSSWNDLQSNNPQLYAMLMGTTYYTEITDEQQRNINFNLVNVGYSNFNITPVHKLGTIGCNLNKNKTLDDSIFNSAGGFKNNAPKSDSRLGININKLFNPVVSTITLATPAKFLVDEVLTHYGNELNKKDQLLSRFITVSGLNNSTTKTSMKSYDGKMIKVGTIYYKLSFVLAHENIDNKINDDNITGDLRSDIASSFANSLSPVLTPITDVVYSNNTEQQDPTAENISNFGTFEIDYKYNDYILNYQEQNLVVNTTIPDNINRLHCVDAQYDMFCIPFKNNNEEFKIFTLSSGVSTTKAINSAAGLAIAQQISTTFGKENIYDIQILPYCPITEWIKEITPTLPTTVRPQRFQIRTDEPRTVPIKDNNNNVVSYMIWCSRSIFKGELKQNQVFPEPISQGGVIQLWNQCWTYEAKDPKVEKSVYKYRLTGGNYASMFDFTPTMNNGITQFNYYCDYKPFQPFIKINPQYDYLYGQDYRDATGLILSGDYSVTMLTNIWTEYKLNNKNYQASFDRNIQSLQVQQDVQMTEAIFGAVAGTVGGGVQGAVTGAKGGVAGAIAGAAIGTGLGVVGGAIDISNIDKLQKDTLDNQLTQHRYQLENIQALPETIQKVTTINQINKIVPIFEEFRCTDKELEAFNSYIRYNGMTVGRIGTINEFKDNGGYIQGRFLRINNLNDDYHVASELNKTFEAGFYLNEGDE